MSALRALLHAVAIAAIVPLPARAADVLYVKAAHVIVDASQPEIASARSLAVAAMRVVGAANFVDVAAKNAIDDDVIRVVHPDERSQAAFASVGGNLLDPSVREAVARAGRNKAGG